jgi:uncharacterized protein
MSELLEFRATKDHFFAHDPDSPLSAEQKRRFKGLQYFPDNPALRIEANLEVSATQDEIEMPTSTGEAQVYQRLGRVRFMVDEQPVELTVYINEGGYFLPFVDSLAGRETYPGGRYLEPEPLGAGRFQLDFNYAYNPYCAYNDQWSCPLTPFENRLAVPIRAGEKLFEH